MGDVLPHVDGINRITLPRNDVIHYEGWNKKIPLRNEYRHNIWKAIIGDGNCGFRTISFIIYGTEDYYQDVRNRYCHFLERLVNSSKKSTKKHLGFPGISDEILGMFTNEVENRQYAIVPDSEEQLPMKDYIKRIKGGAYASGDDIRNMLLMAGLQAKAITSAGRLFYLLNGNAIVKARAGFSTNYPVKMSIYNMPPGEAKGTGPLKEHRDSGDFVSSYKEYTAGSDELGKPKYIFQLGEGPGRITILQSHNHFDVEYDDESCIPNPYAKECFEKSFVPVFTQEEPTELGRAVIADPSFFSSGKYVRTTSGVV